MRGEGRWQEALYYLLAAAGLIGTVAQLPAYLDRGFIEANIAFWKDTVPTPAATFILVDLFVLGAAVLVWMFAECRRLQIGPLWAWLYFLGSALIGISFALPLFLAHRQRRIRAAFPEELAAPAGADLVPIVFAVAVALYAVAYSVRHVPG